MALHSADPATDKDGITRDCQVGPTVRTAIGAFQAAAPALKDPLLSPDP